MLIAHRAKDNHAFFENTKEAVIYCLKQDYIDGIEIDVRITKDKKVVVVHNMLLDLISNGSGLVKNKTLKELKMYTFGKEYQICTLEEILKIMNNKKLLIEIKEESHDYKCFISIINSLIKKYSALDILVCSFNYDLLKDLAKLNNKIKCALIVNQIINNDKIYNHFNSNLVSFRMLSKAKNSDYIWTVNNVETYKKVKKNKDVHIISDVCYKLYNV